MIHYLLMFLGMLAPLLFGVVGFVLAVDPTSRRPGVGILIDLKTGTSSNASGEQRILLISVRNATPGSGAVETLYEAVANADAVGALAGYGGLAHLAAKRLFEEYPTATLDVLFMAAASGNQATGTITFDDATAVSVDQTVTVRIGGYSFTETWAVGETDVDIATKIVSRITALSKFLPVTAANGGGTLAAVTLTFKSKGKAGLDLRYSAALSEGTGGNVSTAAARLTGGTTEPDVTTCLTKMLGREWRLIVPTLSNADLAATAADKNMGLLMAHMKTNGTGIGALLQTVHVVCTDSTTNAKALSAALDFEYASHHLARGAWSLPCEWAGAIVGAYARDTKADPNHPFIQQPLALARLVGTLDIATDGLLASEEEDLLAHGVSYIGRTAQGVPRFERPITTYYEDADGNADDRVLDVSKTFGMMSVGADLRTFMQRVGKGKKLAKTLPTGSTPIPPNIITEDSAKSLILGRLRSKHVADGVIRGDKLEEVVTDGSLIVQVDGTDETQLDVFLPLRIVPPLVKTSIVLVQA